MVLHRFVIAKFEKLPVVLRFDTGKCDSPRPTECTPRMIDHRFDASTTSALALSEPVVEEAT